MFRKSQVAITDIIQPPNDCQISCFQTAVVVRILVHHCRLDRSWQWREHAFASTERSQHYGDHWPASDKLTRPFLSSTVARNSRPIRSNWVQQSCYNDLSQLRAAPVLLKSRTVGRRKRTETTGAIGRWLSELKANRTDGSNHSEHTH
jgi:hypothetical protein